MLIESARILRRRYLWVVLAVILAVFAGGATYKMVTPQQESTANVLFVPPAKEPETGKAVNPFYSLGGSTITMTTVVQVLVSDDKVASQLKNEGNDAKYEINPNLAQNAGPSLLIKVTDPSPAKVTSTLNAVLAQIKSNLRQVQTQQGVSDALLIQDIPLTKSPRPTAVHKTQVQLAFLAVVGVLFFLIVMIILLERRRLPREPVEVESDIDEPLNLPRGPRRNAHRTVAPTAERGRPSARRGDRKTRVSRSAPGTPPTQEHGNPLSSASSAPDRMS